MAYVVQPVGASFARSIDWTTRTPSGAAISTSTWAVVPSDVGVSESGDTFDGLVTQTTVAATTAGVIANLVNTVTFDDGSIDEQGFTVRVSEFAEVA